MISSDRTPIIIVEGLTASLGESTIFEDVSFEVYRGEIFAILGGSGCGKSTLMKHMIGLHEPVRGSVSINGINITTADESLLRRAYMDVGIAFQSTGLLSSMTLGENVALPLSEYTDLSPGAIRLVVKMKLGMVRLAGYENHFPAELSGGMKKRAGLARAMALDPMVLFCDEPEAGLDPVTSAELDDLIQGINAGMGTTMVIITHELHSILNIAHRVIMLDKDEKGIIAEGDPRWLRDHSTDPRVFSFFNRQTQGKRFLKKPGNL